MEKDKQKKSSSRLSGLWRSSKKTDTQRKESENNNKYKSCEDLTDDVNTGDVKTNAPVRRRWPSMRRSKSQSTLNRNKCPDQGQGQDTSADQGAAKVGNGDQEWVDFKRHKRVADGNLHISNQRPLSTGEFRNVDWALSVSEANRGVIQKPYATNDQQRGNWNMLNSNIQSLTPNGVIPSNQNGVNLNKNVIYSQASQPHQNHQISNHYQSQQHQQQYQQQHHPQQQNEQTYNDAILAHVKKLEAVRDFNRQKHSASHATPHQVQYTQPKVQKVQRVPPLATQETTGESDNNSDIPMETSRISLDNNNKNQNKPLSISQVNNSAVVGSSRGSSVNAYIAVTSSSVDVKSMSNASQTVTNQPPISVSSYLLNTTTTTNTVLVNSSPHYSKQNTPIKTNSDRTILTDISQSGVKKTSDLKPPSINLNVSPPPTSHCEKQGSQLEIHNRSCHSNTQPVGYNSCPPGRVRGAACRRS